MLVFASLVPHPPLIIPTIGQEHSSLMEKTIISLKYLEQELYAAKPELILIISPHGNLMPDSFTINLCEEYQANFKAFGDFNSNFKYQGNTHFLSGDKIEKIAKSVPINVISDPELDHGSSVPLYYLLAHLKNTPIVPVGYSFLDYNKHIDFGVALKELIADSPLRIAVIASGDMSHRLSQESAAGYSPQGQKFDEKIQELIQKKNLTGLVSLEPKLIEEAGECGFRSLMILFGIIKKMNWQPEILSYESPLGIGYLTINFKLV